MGPPIQKWENPYRIKFRMEFALEMGREIWIRACGCLGIDFRMRWVAELQDFHNTLENCRKFLFQGENGFLKKIRFMY